jgi:Tol biopolymer transport system component
MGHPGHDTRPATRGRRAIRATQRLPWSVAAAVAAVSVFAACGSAAPLRPADSAATTAGTAATTGTAGTTSDAEPGAAPPAWAIQGSDGRLVVQVMASDGSGRTSPAADAVGGDQTNPDWSPDGRQLVFVMTDKNGHDDLWVTHADGSGSRMLFDCNEPCDDLDDPAWSPDGRSIATCKFVTAAEDVHLGTLVSVDTATGAATTLYTPARRKDFCAGPRWAPDGRSLVLEVVRRDGTGAFAEAVGVSLSIVDLSVRPATARELTDPALFAANADWSRDGRLIVYSARPKADGEATDLFTIAPDGSDIRRRTALADRGGSAREPAFDVDGSSVVFVAEGAAPLSRVDLASGTLGTAFAADTAGDHPRPRPPGT